MRYWAKNANISKFGEIEKYLGHPTFRVIVY